MSSLYLIWRVDLRGGGGRGWNLDKKGGRGAEGGKMGYGKRGGKGLGTLVSYVAGLVEGGVAQSQSK